MQASRLTTALAAVALLAGAVATGARAQTSPATALPQPSPSAAAPPSAGSAAGTPPSVPPPSAPPSSTAPAVGAPPSAAPAGEPPLPPVHTMAPRPLPGNAPVRTMAPRPLPGGLANPPGTLVLGARALQAKRSATGYVLTGQAQVKDGCQAARFDPAPPTSVPPQVDLVQYRRPTSMGVMCMQTVRWVAAQPRTATTAKPPAYVTVRTAAGTKRVPIR